MSNEDVLFFFFRQYDRKGGNLGYIDSNALAECMEKLGCNLTKSEFETYVRGVIDNPNQVVFSQFINFCEVCLGQDVKIAKSSGGIDSSIVVKDVVDAYEYDVNMVKELEPNTEPISKFLPQTESCSSISNDDAEKHQSFRANKFRLSGANSAVRLREPNPIFCFLYDPLAFNAIGSVCRQIKNCTIGLIIPGGREDGGNTEAAVTEEESIRQRVKAVIPEIASARVVVKHGITRLTNWNKGQYKLDLALFADEFFPVVWMDSTARVLADPTPVITRFFDSAKLFGFLPHYLANEPQMQAQDDKLFVPRGYFLLFNSHVLKGFCVLWEEMWREYITPFPFATVPNPAPGLLDSLYLIDQYAMSKAVSRSIASFESDVYVIPRADLQVYETGQNRVTQLETHFSCSPWAIPSKQSVH